MVAPFGLSPKRINCSSYLSAISFISNELKIYNKSIIQLVMKQLNVHMTMHRLDYIATSFEGKYDPLGDEP